jgi:Cu2+-exporting ATPase
MPEVKADIIKKLKAEGKMICYVGDGINDAIAMKESHVSVSLRGASTVATDTAQIILLDKGLEQLGVAFDLAADFHDNLNRTFAIIISPAILSVSGVFLSGFGLIHSLAFRMTGVAVGLGNSMYPLLKYDSTYESFHNKR